MDRRERIDDLQTALVATLGGWQAKLWTALPGIVLSYDAAKNVCSVQAALKMLRLLPDGTEQWISVPPLLDCPVVFPGGGGFSLTFPIAAGDECLVVFASRCIDAWWDSSGEQQQSEFRMHDLSDGFVLPGLFSRPKVPESISTSDVQLRSADATTYISLAPDGLIKLQTAGDLEAHAATATVTAPTITLNGNVTINGATSFNGPVSQVPGTQSTGGSMLFDGPAVFTNDVTAAGKSVSTHHHVEHDGPSTGGPV